jgi:hypothetical protein
MIDMFKNLNLRPIHDDDDDHDAADNDDDDYDENRNIFLEFGWKKLKSVETKGDTNTRTLLPRP